MKGQKKITILLIAVMLLVCIAYFAVRRYQANESRGKPLIGNYTAYSTGAGTIAEIRGTCVGGSFDVIRSDGVWSYAESAGTPDTGRVSRMESLLLSIPAERELKDVEDLSVYGLEDPQLTIELTFEDGAQNTLSVGFYNSVIDQYYFRVDDSRTVYTVDPAIYSSFAVTDNTIAEQETISSESAAEVPQ
ncbi:DUF4340 domain-containing protein [Lachnoclostridium sp. Marseille-P6806]|uniref:DUF4340 domain-containing protein n=1 Tax=Lachnoclostridium sp. Marseille-P6806 TaxID=2364793 RepID=UPI0013EF0367|nr:DUF4340 domain-containing protein [Lachnoclostridium sp. Marseille-P6806]